MADEERSYFDGNLWQYLGWTILGGLIAGITLGICTPWAVCMIQSWKAKHTVIDGHRCQFDGNAFQLFGTWIKWVLLIIVTLGIYSFFIPIRMTKWVTKHTHFQD